MTARVWPADSVDTNADGIRDTPSYTGRWLRQTAVTSFTSMGAGTRPLGSVSGVRPGTPTNIATATSTTWTVTPFSGVIDGEASAIAGGYTYAFDANVTGSVTAAGASARADRLDVVVSDPAEGDGTGSTTPPNVAIVYTVGTPTLAAAPARSHPLAQINVPATGGGSPTVTWTASYFAAPGAVVPFNLLSALKAWTPAMDGQLAIAYDTDNTWQYMAGATIPGWYHVSGKPTLDVVTYNALYGSWGTSPLKAATQNGRINLEGAITNVSTATFTNGVSYAVGNVPTALAPLTVQSYTGTWGGTGLAAVTVAPGTGAVSMEFTTSPGGPLSAGGIQIFVSGMSWRHPGI